MFGRGQSGEQGCSGCTLSSGSDASPLRHESSSLLLDLHLEVGHRLIEFCQLGEELLGMGSHLGWRSCTDEPGYLAPRWDLKHLESLEKPLVLFTVPAADCNLLVATTNGLRMWLLIDLQWHILSSDVEL